MPGIWNMLARRLFAALLIGAPLVIGAAVAPAQAAAMDCAYAVAPLYKAAVSAGESPIVNVSVTGSGCSWTAVSNDAWITVTSGVSGTSTGPSGLTIAANTSATARTGTVTIAGQTLTITQNGTGTCLYSVVPLTKSALAAGDSGNVTVTSGANCAWTAVSNSAWISLTSNPMTVGSGTAALTIDQNPDATQRIGTMTIAGQTYTVTQAAPPGCTYNISPITKSAVAAGESTTVAVTSPAGCPWTAASPVQWIAVTDGASGTGNGTVTLAIDTNTATAQRSAALTIAGRTFTVTQVGTGACAFTVGPAARSSPASGETTSTTVTTGDTCVWSAASGAPWILVSAGASGSGTGTVTLTVAANSGAQRTGTVTIAGQSFTVTQAPGCLHLHRDAGHTEHFRCGSLQFALRCHFGRLCLGGIRDALLDHDHDRAAVGPRALVLRHRSERRNGALDHIDDRRAASRGHAERRAPPVAHESAGGAGAVTVAIFLTKSPDLPVFRVILDGRRGTHETTIRAGALGRSGCRGHGRGNGRPDPR